MGNSNLLIPIMGIMMVHKRVKELQIFPSWEITCTSMGNSNFLIPIMGIMMVHKRVKELQIFPSREITCTSMGNNNLLIPIMDIEMIHISTLIPRLGFKCHIRGL